MARRTRRRAIAGAGMVVAARLRSSRTARRNAAALVSSHGTSALVSTYAAGAAVLMATLADQTTLTWPDEFPRKIERADKPEGS
jgi:hypothetical protein